MQCFANGPIKLSRIGRLEHDAEIVAISPIALSAKLRPHTFIEDSARQRIRKRNPYVVRSDLANQGDRLLEFGPCLPWIAELQEKACTNADVSQPLPRNLHRSQSDPFIHCVQDGLGSGFYAHPNFGTSGGFQMKNRILAH